MTTLNPGDQCHVQLNGTWVLLTVGGPDQRFVDMADGTEYLMTVEEYERKGENHDK